VITTTKIKDAKKYCLITEYMDRILPQNKYHLVFYFLIEINQSGEDEEYKRKKYIK